jgi:hypothetical protein
MENYFPRCTESGLIARLQLGCGEIPCADIPHRCGEVRKRVPDFTRNVETGRHEARPGEKGLEPARVDVNG